MKMPEQIQAFFYKQLFHKQRQAEIGKKIKQHPEAKFSLFDDYLHSLYTLSARKIIRGILRKMQKSKGLLIYEITRLIIMKIKMKMKNRSHRCGKNRPRCRHGHKYSK